MCRILQSADDVLKTCVCVYVYRMTLRWSWRTRMDTTGTTPESFSMTSHDLASTLNIHTSVVRHLVASIGQRGRMPHFPSTDGLKK